MVDENGNHVPDRFETYFTYFVAIFALAAGGYSLFVTKDGQLTKWSIVIAAVLTGGNDVLDKIMRLRK